MNASVPLLPKSFASATAQERPRTLYKTAERAHTAIQITPQLCTQRRVPAITNVSITGPVLHTFHSKVFEHVYSRLQLTNPVQRESICDANIDDERYQFKHDIFGEDRPTTHFRADLFVQSKLHWGYHLDDHLGFLRLYNVRPKLITTWNDCLLSDENNIVSWQSKFPGTLHAPYEQLDFKVMFQLKANNSTVLTPADLVTIFTGKNAGTVDIMLSKDNLQRMLVTDQISHQRKIVPHFISLHEVHSNLPVPVHLQLRTTSVMSSDKDNVPGAKTEWMRNDTASAAGLIGPIVYPNTHSTAEKQVFELSEVAREAMFFRWINTDHSEVMSILDQTLAEDHYYLPTPELDDKQFYVPEAPFSNSIDENGEPIEIYDPVLNSVAVHDVVKVNDTKRSQFQSKPEAIHVSNLASFIVLDEWKRLQDIRKLTKKPDTTCRVEFSEDGKGEFVVHKDLLDPIVREKFDGAMDPPNHIMNTDDDMHLRINLINAPGQGREELLEVLRNLHPTVDFPQVGHQTSSLPQGLAQKKQNPGPAIYSLSVVLRIQCARLESGTSYFKNS